MMRISAIMFAGVLLLSGCVSAPLTPFVPPDQPTENAETLVQLGSGMQPENLLFPDYLLMVNFEIGQHGRISGSPLVGAEMMTEMELSTARERFVEVLNANEWVITRLETAKQFFRLEASLREATLEIRAVQGTGPTKVFLLYRPNPESSL